MTERMSEPQPHQHHCAAKPAIHSAGRETPANRDADGHYYAIYNPAACTCENPAVPQCCENHPTAQPGYVPRHDPTTTTLGLYADEMRGLKERIASLEADALELKQELSRQRQIVAKFEKYAG